jgi:hypothetical protein
MAGKVDNKTAYLWKSEEILSITQGRRSASGASRDYGGFVSADWKGWIR